MRYIKLFEKWGINKELEDLTDEYMTSIKENPEQNDFNFVLYHELGNYVFKVKIKELGGKTEGNITYDVDIVNGKKRTSNFLITLSDRNDKSTLLHELKHFDRIVRMGPDDGAIRKSLKWVDFIDNDFNPNIRSIFYLLNDDEFEAKYHGYYSQIDKYLSENLIENPTREDVINQINFFLKLPSTDKSYTWWKNNLYFKLELLGDAGDAETYLFGTVNRNSARKDLASLILGFATFKHHNQVKAVLYLHCNPIDPSGININRLCERVGLKVGVDVLFPKDFSENKGCDNKQLNRIYNAFNCFITTTTAEGWGLTVTEAMATKTLVICPKHTSLTEITNNGDLTLNFMFLQHSVFVNDFEKIRFTCNPNEVNTLLGVAYNLINDEEELQFMVAEKIQRAYDKVKGMTWEIIAKQFKVKIDKLAK